MPSAGKIVSYGYHDQTAIFAQLTAPDSLAEGTEVADTEFYTCGMHPWVILPQV